MHTHAPECAPEGTACVCSFTALQGSPESGSATVQDLPRPCPPQPASSSYSKAPGGALHLKACQGESAPEGMPGVNSPSLSGLRSITHRPTGSKGPPSSPVPMDPELFTQTGVGCLQRHSGCILQTRDEHTQTKEYSGNECLTSGLAREAGKLWSIFLGPTTFPYKSSMPMTLGAVRSHLINEHILDGNNIFK